MLEIVGILITLFYLALPFLIYNLYQKIKSTHARIDKLNERVSELQRTIAAGEDEGIQTDTSKQQTKTAARVIKPELTPAPVTKIAVAKPGVEVPQVKPPAPEIPRTVLGDEAAEKVTPELVTTHKAENGWGEIPREIPTTNLEKIIKAWLFGGNTVARVGVVILFFGVAFFLKYAVDRGWLPVELRMTAAAIGGMILIVFGWRLRIKRPNYALILQGGGIGIVYLTVFATVSLYELIPFMPGLVLMVVLVALSSALAVLQNARSLAVLACVGGFLAPVLISRDGSHITLFSYYAILNVGILAIAWFKAWRELNLIGFIFTFVIASLWGYQYYQPSYFATVEPFLVLFFLFYVAVPVLFAHRQPPNLKGYIDGSLIFGVPLVGFGLQSTLVRDFEYGLALSAVIAGLVYAILATVLWQRRQEFTRMLIEVFIALAVAFGTVAIPLAVDGRWTGAAWALEGAALVWVGLRQRRLLAQLFGLLVQLCAGAAFLTEFTAAPADTPILNSFYMSALMVSAAGLFSAYHLYRTGQQHEHTSQTSHGMLIWGLVWWFAAGGNEIWIHVDDAYHYAAALVFVSLSLAGIAFLRRRLLWSELVYVMPLLLPVMVIIAIFSYIDASMAHPFYRWGLPAWLLAFAMQYWVLRKFETEWRSDLTKHWHLGTFWLLVFIMTWEVVWLVRQAVPEVNTWSHAMWALVPAAVIALLPATRRKLVWPLQHFDTVYMSMGLAPLVVISGLWALYASIQQGDPSPLIYIPVINPHEMTQLFVLVVTYFWLRQSYIQIDNKLRWYSWFAVAFVVMNGIIARAIHFYGDVPFSLDTLWNSPRYQTTVSIIWTLAALLIMVAATRMKQRFSWIIGSVLLVGVVVKLFLVDLADIGTIARIISFIVVGLLILLIGYFSPMPPKAKEE